MTQHPGFGERPHPGGPPPGFGPPPGYPPRPGYPPQPLGGGASFVTPAGPDSTLAGASPPSPPGARPSGSFPPSPHATHAPPASSPFARPLDGSSATVVGGDAPAHAPTLRESGSARLPAPDGQERIGPYAIERELARGGMGVVYVATHLQLRRRVALKVQLAAPGTADAERFHIEAQAAARLSHPHIVAIFDVGEDAGRPYLAMDLIEGQSMRERINDVGPLDPDEVARIGAKVADALYYAHTRAILHRDIKPHNILLDAAGEPRLTDFGLAKQTDQEESGLTKTGQMMGTPAYMPPEQADGDLDRIDRRADVYSLGATLYEGLVGDPPFEGQTAVQIVYRVLREDPTPPRKLRPEIDPDLETIVLKCLEKDPEQRYASAKELKEDLDRYLEGEPIQARSVGPLGRLVRRVRRNRGAARGFAAVIGASVLALGAAALVANQQRQLAVAKAREADEALGKEAQAREKAETATQAAERAAAEARQKGAEAQAERVVAEVRAELLHGLARLQEHDAGGASRAFEQAMDRLRREGKGLPAARRQALAQTARHGAQEAARKSALLGRLPSSAHEAGRHHDGEARCATAPGHEPPLVAVTHGGELELFQARGEGFVRVATRQLPRGNVRCLRFSPDARALAVGVNAERDSGWTLTFFDLVDGGRELRVRWERTRQASERELGYPLADRDPHGMEAGPWLFSPDGALLLGGFLRSVWALEARDGGVRKILDSTARDHAAPAARGDARRVFGSLERGARPICGDLEGQLLAVGYDDGLVRIWDMIKSALVYEWQAHQTLHGAVLAARYIPAGAFGAGPGPGGVRLLTAGADGEAFRWEISEKGQRTGARFSRGLDGPVRCQSVAGGVVALGHEAGVVRLWDDRLEPLAALQVGRHRVVDCAPLPGDRLVTSCGGEFRVWRVRPPRRVAASRLRFDETALSFGSRRRLAHTEAAPGQAAPMAVNVIDPERPERVLARLPLMDPTDPGVDPDGRRNLRPNVVGVSLSDDDARAAVALQPWRSFYKGLREPGRHDLYRLTAAGAEREQRIVHECADRDRLDRPFELVGRPAFAPGGERLLLGYQRFNHPGLLALRVLDARDAAERARLPWHMASVRAARWSPRGDALLTGAEDGTLALWRPDAAQPLARVFSPALSDDGAPAPTATPGRPPEGKSAREEWFRGATGRRPPEHAAWPALRVQACALGEVPHASGAVQAVVAGTASGELVVWSEEGELLARWQAHAGPVLGCAVLGDGRVASVGGEVRVWDLGLGVPARLRDIALTPPPGKRAAETSACAFSPDGELVAVVTDLEEVTGLTRQEIVLLDLSTPALPGFEQDADAAVAALRAHVLVAEQE